MMDHTIEAYRELLEAAQQVLSVPALRQNGGDLPEAELKRRQLRLESAAKNLARECELETPVGEQPKQAQLHLV